MTKRILNKAKVLVIIGSASKVSSNSRLMEVFRAFYADELEIMTYQDLGTLPHFDPSLSDSLPVLVGDLLAAIESADGVIFCTPEYIFSIPARLKNLLEWCVATTVFMDKPVGLITASADGRQGHAQMKLIMQTLGARLTEETELIISGIRGKFDDKAELVDHNVHADLNRFATAFLRLIKRGLLNL